MELLRRMALLVSAMLFCWFLYGVASGPLFGVMAVDFGAEQKSHGGMLPDEAERKARKLPPEAFRQMLLEQAGDAGSEECVRLVAAAARASARGGEGMRDRLGPDQSGGRPPLIFFSEAELPGGCLSFLPASGASASLRTLDGEVPLAEARRYPTGPDEFQLGSGYARYPSPPANLLYPRRWLAWIALVLGAAAYVLLPRRRPEPGDAHYATGRVALADSLGAGLFLFFFCLPFLIAGGSPPLLGEAWPLAAIFWGLSLFGAAILVLDAAHASLRLRAEEDGVRIFGLSGTRRLSYAEITDVLVEVKRPSALVRRGLWLAAVFGGGPTVTGMAMMQSSATPLCLRLEAGQGRGETVWLTDQTGMPILLNARPLLTALDRAGVPGAAEALGRLPGGQTESDG